MKIGVNLLPVVPGKIGGMEQYIRNLMWFATHEHSHYEFFLFVNESNAYSFSTNVKGITLVLIQEGPNRNIEIHEHVDKLNIDIWFCPLLTLDPFYMDIPTAITIPDLQHEYFPEFFDADILQWRMEQFGASAKKADAVFTLSEYSKGTIVERLNVSSDKVHVIHLDATKEFYESIDPIEAELIQTRYNLPSSYAFYPANTWPHKNHINLLCALTILKEKYGVCKHLVLTGSEKDAHSSLRQFIAEKGIKDQVTFLGYIPQDCLPYIYAKADYLVFPSLFEGFGIPLVEAMRSGTPIACSNVSSIPEVVADSALLFDPKNPEAIADKLAMMENEDVQRELSSRGAQRSDAFSWRHSANATLSVFDKLVEEKNIVKNVPLPLVSVITPSFNQGKFIRETIDSVLNQDYPNLEYIVMDGGSTDETVEILKSYGDRIRWVSEPDEGQADAVNKGVKLANGEIIGWLNSDDTYLAGAIRNAVSALTRHQEVGMVYGEGYHVTETGDIMDRYPTETFHFNRLAETCFICQPTAFIRRSVWESVQGLDKNLHLCMDYELWIRVGKAFPIAYVAKFIATSRMYEDNKTLSRRTEVYREIMKTVHKHYGFVPISWVYGYVDYLLGGAKNPLLFPYLLYFTFKYNLGNIKYFLRVSKRLVKDKIKDKTSTTRFRGRYEDGWVSKNYTCSLNTEDLPIGINVHARHLWPLRGPLKIKALVNGQTVKHVVVRKHGEFKFTVPLPEGAKRGEAVVTLIANRSFIPHKKGINADVRRLSYIVEHIGV